jgi:arylsulfatase A-like enzyme
MRKSLSRREFIKLAGLLPFSALALPRLLPRFRLSQSAQQNVLILVFDAWSAANISLYGYERVTTPNLDRLAEKAVVYHNHYSGGNFTTPGTASLLTGALPWSHRAFTLNDTVHSAFARKSIFHLFESYHRIAYTHNPIARTLLRQFMDAINQYIPMVEFYLDQDFLVDVLFARDRDVATVSVNRALKNIERGFAYSPYLSHIYQKYKARLAEKRSRLEPDFPRGIPNYDGISYFTLEQGIDGLLSQLRSIPQPFLGYYHFLPPHNPYKTRLDFYNQFAQDGYTPIRKPDHILAEASLEEPFEKRRRQYDEFILYVDYEFDRLYNQLQASGLLENTWLILTSDHGEMFERGILGHMTPSLHQPVIHTPLIIFPPGQTSRVDVYQPTSAVDLLPTLANIASLAIPSWAEGHILPPFAASPPAVSPDVVALQVEETEENGHITTGTLMLVRDQHKLIWFFGYPELGQQGEFVELYDLSTDPQELHNLAEERANLTADLLAAAKVRLADMDKPSQ